MAKYLCVTNITGLLLSCAVVIFGQELIFFGLLQKDICLKEDEVCGKFFSNKISVSFVTQDLSFFLIAVLSCCLSLL